MISETVRVTPLALLQQLEAQNAEFWLEDGALRFRAPQGIINPEITAQLKACKPELIALLKERELGLKLTPASDPQDRYQPFAISDVQAAYLIGRQNIFEYGGTGCHGYFEVEFGKLDHKALSRAWNRLIERHDMLRAIVMGDGQQKILPQVPQFNIGYRQGSEARFAYREAMSHRVYHTETWPLFDLAVSSSDGVSYLHFSIDLLVADFLSIQIVLSELLHLYHHPDLVLPPLSLSFKDVIEYERRQKLTVKYGRARQYWHERIDELPSCPALPRAGASIDTAMTVETRDHASDRAPGFTRYEAIFSPAEWQALESQCQQQGVTPSSLLMTLYSEVIARWSDSQHFCLNLTVMNREPMHPDLMRMVGDFTSVNLLEVDLRERRPLAEQVRIQQNQLWQDLEHKVFSGIEVVRELARKHGAEYARMPVVFTSALVGNQREQVSQTMSHYDMGLEMVFGISQTPQVWIDCQLMTRDQRLCVNWDVLDGIFPPHMIESMFAAFENAIRNVLVEGETAWRNPVGIPLPQRQQETRRQVNDTQHPMPDVMLHQLVLQQAIETPDAIALKTPQRQLTYRELVAEAQQLATRLPRSQRVAVAMEKSAQQVVATLAILLADGVYLPLDISQPMARIGQILSNAQVGLVLTDHEELARRFTEDGFNAMNILSEGGLADGEQIQPVNVSSTTERLAYIIYTSGSTGTPKGVMVSHRAAVNTVLDINRRFQITGQDVVLGLAKLSFDLSVYDIFGTLACGATLVLPTEDALKNPALWARLIQTHKITVWNSVPAQMNMLTRYLADEACDTDHSPRIVMMSGDWIPVDLPQEIARNYPAAAIFSLGGATEAAIWSIFYPVDPKACYGTSIPYGRPLANQVFMVRDAHGRPCPDWVAGELCIGGVGVALGYWQDQEKTQHHFFSDEESGLRWYRTGDRGYYRDDGVLVFVGRNDHQIKIRGHRIELGEIESALEQQQSVSQAVVIARGEKHQRYLQAYVQPGVAAQPDQFQRLSGQFSQTRQHLDKLAGRIRQATDLAAVEDFVCHLDQVALLHMNQALQESGGLAQGESKTLPQVMSEGNYAARHEPLLSRWMMALQAHGLATQTRGRYRLTRGVDPAEIERCWQGCYQALERLGGDKGLVGYLERSSQCLPELLRDTADPLDLLFPEGNLDVATAAYQNNLLSVMMNRMLVTATLEKVAHLGEVQRPIRILEIGAGVGGTSNELIPALAGKPVEYTFTDVSPFFLNAARERYEDYDFIRYRLYDFNRPALAQGLDCGQFDIIVSSNVLHNAVVAREGLHHLRELLSPGGWLLVIEATRDNYQLMTSMEFKHGLTEHQDERLELNSPFMPQELWLQAIRDVGGDCVYAFPDPREVLHQLGQSFMMAQFNSGKARCDKAVLTEMLATRLPEHMLPGQLAIMDSLPLTANGKLDRSVLPEIMVEEHESTLETTEQLDSLALTLLTTCREIIGNPAMSASDDFFSAGGDSLLITQWVSRIRKELGEDRVPWEGTLRQVLLTPTVLALAEFLRQQTAMGNASDSDATQKPSLQSPMQLLKAGSGDPVIVIHDGSGTVMPCLNLIEQLKAPVYGVSVTDHQHYLTLPQETLIVDLAYQYKTLIAEQLDLEQCHIFGFCMGGLIAFELVRQCLDKGITVSSLTIASSYQIPYLVNDPMMTDLALAKELGLGNPWPELELAELEETYLAVLEDKPSAVCPADVVACAGRLGYTKLAESYLPYAQSPEHERVGMLQRLLEQHPEPGMRNWDIRSMYPVFHHSVQAVSHYQPAFYCGDLTFACQQEPTYLLPTLKTDMLAFWQEFGLGEIAHIPLSGDHFTCMQHGAVEPLAEALNQRAACEVPHG